MYKYILLCFAFFIFNINSSFCQTPKTLNGRWINSNYVQALKKYKSPKEAEIKTNLFYFDFKDDTICITDDLHTSNSYFALTNLLYDNNSKTLNFTLGGDKLKQKIKIINYNKIQWIGTLKNRNNKYENVKIVFTKLTKPFQQYCNELVIAGSYKDKTGQTYTFTNTEIAIWPNKTFKYEVCTSYYGIDGNCIINYSEFDSLSNSFIAYGFKFINGKLYLYNEDKTRDIEADWTYFKTTPFLILNKN